MLNLHILDGSGTYLGPLPSATRIAYLAELNSPGGGSFEINPDATDAALIVNERIVEVRWLTSAIGHWTIQTIDEPLVGATRAAMTKVSGQGLLGLLRKAVLYPHAWPALTDPDAVEAPLVCGPSVGIGFVGMFNGNVDFPFTLSFSPTKDTNLATWPNDVALEFRAGQNMLDVVNGLAGLGYDFILSSSRTLDAYVAAGNSVTYTIVFTEGKNLLALSRKRESGDHATVVLGAGQTAIVQSEDFAWSTRRRQAYLPARNAADEQQVAAVNALFLDAVRQPVDSYEMRVRNDPVALYQYWLGDTIRVVTRKGQFTLRVLSIHIEQSGNDQIITLGVNEQTMNLNQRLATAINGETTVGAAAAGRLVAPDVRITRPIVTFDWHISGEINEGDQLGPIYQVNNRLQILGVSGGVETAPGSDAIISMEYSLDAMTTWVDVFSANPKIGGNQKEISGGKFAVIVLHPGTYLRLNVDDAGSSAMQDLSVRLRCREV